MSISVGSLYRKVCVLFVEQSSGVAMRTGRGQVGLRSGPGSETSVKSASSPVMQTKRVTSSMSGGSLHERKYRTEPHPVEKGGDEMCG